jgi:hypothetical protein
MVSNLDEHPPFNLVNKKKLKQTKLCFVNRNAKGTTVPETFNSVPCSVKLLGNTGGFRVQV